MRNNKVDLSKLISEETFKNPYVISSAYRTLQVLKAFVAPPHQFSLSELMNRSGLEKNQLYRSLKTLEEAGYLSVNGDGRFRLTPLLNSLSAAAATTHGQQKNLADIAAPFLDEVAAVTQETVNLFVRAGDLAVCIDRRDSAHQVKLTSVLGVSVPLHAGAVPKAILAHLPEAEQRRVLEQLPGLPRYTEKTLLDSEALERELATIRERGYALSDEDYDASARGVGAPIFSERGEVIAGISVGGPSFRVDDRTLAHFSQLITRIARALSQRLGYSG
ncbi:IclR family transcriptional regulator [soil metagenome]